jgi:zinc transport system substrate-binding protein
MNRSIKILFIVFGMLFVLIGDIYANDKLPVFVSIVPQKYFVQQIGKELVDVRIMVRPGASPAIYEPKPRQMADLSKTKIYFAIGVPFEKAWLKKIAAANPNMTVVHTDHGIEKLAMAAHHHTGEKGDHRDHQDGLDPHIWLSPQLVKIQTRTILAALVKIDPKHQDVYQANYKAFSAKIDQLDVDLKKIFADKRGLQFMVFHPSWGYFAQAYGLKQVPIEIEGKEPKPAQLRGLIQHARKDGIKVIFVQPQFSTKSAQLVAHEIGGQVVPADPLAEEWMANLRAVAAKFKTALK